ncbi:MAG TPA: (d)CMP kinase [Vitreimonas sp.]|nr:(d)CMP kinase [Vitreimonas sp.]
MSFHIAIDGPVAAGKGTVSKLVAERLGFVYIDTGAMYRMTAYLAKQEGVAWEDELGLAKMVAAAEMDMRAPVDEERDGRLSTQLLNGDDVSWKIRTEEIGTGASQVAQLSAVRAELVKKQQQIAVGKDVVMEGRDITYRVLPGAQLKIYLTASDIVRAKRRHLQLQTKGEDVSLETVYAELVERDKRDMERSVDPLQIVEGAWVVDTSDLNIDEAVELIVARTKALKG